MLTVLLLEASPIPAAVNSITFAHIEHATDVWTVVTAIASVIVAVGIVIAARQFALTRKFSKVVETDHLIREFWRSPLVKGFRRIEKFDDIGTYLDRSRHRVNRLYERLFRLRFRKRYRALWKSVNAFIQDTATMTDRIEVYIRKGSADEAIVAEHIGYYIVVGYYILQNILQSRVLGEDYTYEAFRDLALRCQNYGKLYPDDSELRPELCWASMPELADARGERSVSYMPRWAYVRKLRIKIADWRHAKAAKSSAVCEPIRWACQSVVLLTLCSTLWIAARVIFDAGRWSIVGALLFALIYIAVLVVAERRGSKAWSGRLFSILGWLVAALYWVATVALAGTATLAYKDVRALAVVPTCAIFAVVAYFYARNLRSARALIVDSKGSIVTIVWLGLLGAVLVVSSAIQFAVKP